MMKMIQQHKCRMIYFILVVIWMMIVFIFSGQNGKQSQGTSDIITDRIVKIFYKLTDNSQDSVEVKNVVSVIVRKLAHFTIYFIGGILIFNLINTFSIKTRYVIILTIIFGMLYAISDEMHQLFIEARAGKVTDVLIDTTGVLLATLIRYMICKNKEEKWKN